MAYLGINVQKFLKKNDLRSWNMLKYTLIER